MRSAAQSASVFAIRLRCVNGTAFGVPVVPDVKSSAAGRSGLVKERAPPHAPESARSEVRAPGRRDLVDQHRARRPTRGRELRAMRDRRDDQVRRCVTQNSAQGAAELGYRAVRRVRRYRPRRNTPRPNRHRLGPTALRSSPARCRRSRAAPPQPGFRHLSALCSRGMLAGRRILDDCGSPTALAKLSTNSRSVVGVCSRSTVGTLGTALRNRRRAYAVAAHDQHDRRSHRRPRDRIDRRRLWMGSNDTAVTPRCESSSERTRLLSEAARVFLRARCEWSSWGAPSGLSKATLGRADPASLRRIRSCRPESSRGDGGAYVQIRMAREPRRGRG